MENEVFKKAKPLHAGHRQRIKNRFEAQGLDSFADHETLEFLLFYALPRRDTNQLAHRLMDECGGLSGVFSADESRLSKAGAGDKAVKLIRLLEEFERLYRRDKTGCAMGFKHLSGARQAKQYSELLFAGCTTDQVWACCLDGKLVVRNCLPLFEGRLKGKKGLRSIISACSLVHSSHLLLMISHGDGQPAFFADELAAIGELAKALTDMKIRLCDVVLYTADGAITLTESGIRLL